MAQKLSLFLLLLFSLVLCSCAGKTGRSADPAEAQHRWQAFMQQNLQKPAPFRDSLSMRFGREGDTRRVTALIWGNAEPSIRLDVLAGVGATVAMIAQKDQHFLLYAPMQRKAYFHEGSNSPLFKVGVPLPFDLFRLEALLNGRYADVFGKTFLKATSAGKAVSYTLDGAIGGELILPDDPTSLTWKNDDWTIQFTLDESRLVHRMDLTSRRADKGVIIIKEREQTAPFTEKQMMLEIPEGTMLLPLEKFRH